MLAQAEPAAPIGILVGSAPSGSSRASSSAAVLASWRGCSWRAASTSIRSATGHASAAISPGIRPRSRTITATCAAEISPARTAAAAAGKIGANASPVNARRGPRSRARSTRAFASTGETRSSVDQQLGRPVTAVLAGHPALGDLGQQPLIDRLQPAPLHLHASQQTRQLRAPQRRQGAASSASTPARSAATLPAAQDRSMYYTLDTSRNRCRIRHVVDNRKRRSSSAACATLAPCVLRCTSSPAARRRSWPWPRRTTRAAWPIPELNHPFSHPDQHPEHVERLADVLGRGHGRAAAVLDRLRRPVAVLYMHAGNGDMTDLGRRFVDCFVPAADDAGLPADPEFRAALRAYMVWAVDDVLAYSPDDADGVPADRAVPRWNWDGAAAPEVGT